MLIQFPFKCILIQIRSTIVHIVNKKLHFQKARNSVYMQQIWYDTTSVWKQRRRGILQLEKKSTTIDEKIFYHLYLYLCALSKRQYSFQKYICPGVRNLTSAVPCCVYAHLDTTVPTCLLSYLPHTTYSVLECNIALLGLFFGNPEAKVL